MIYCGAGDEPDTVAPRFPRRVTIVLLVTISVSLLVSVAVVVTMQWSLVDEDRSGTRTSRGSRPVTMVPPDQCLGESADLQPLVGVAQMRVRRFRRDSETARPFRDTPRACQNRQQFALTRRQGIVRSVSRDIPCTVT